MESEYTKADSRNLPYVDTMMLHVFYKDNPNFVSAEIRNVKAQRATREEYGDEAVGYVQVQRKHKLCTVKAKVTPEHCVRDKAYDVIIQVDEDKEKITTCQCCGCTASLGGCKQSVAVLFWLYRRSMEPASTSVECYWRASSLSKVVKAVKSMSLEEMYNSPPLLLKNDNFLNTVLSQGKEIGSKSILVKQYSQEDAVERTSIHNLILKYCAAKEVANELPTSDDFFTFCEENITDNDCLTVKTMTESQSKTSKWYEARYCRITASRLYEAAKCKTKDGSLTEKLFGANKIPQTEQMIRGLDLEDTVLAEVKKFKNIDCKKCGMVLRNDHPLFGSSPDAISDQYCIEIKCPSQEKTVCNYLDSNNKINNKFLAQIQLQMFMSKKKHMGFFALLLHTLNLTEKSLLLKLYTTKIFVCS